MHLTKGQIINQLNGVNDFVNIQPTGPVKTDNARMSMKLVLQAIAESQALEPGVTCEITDFKVSQDAVTLEFQTGEFAKKTIVPTAVASLFAGNSAPVGDHDFEE